MARRAGGKNWPEKCSNNDAKRRKGRRGWILELNRPSCKIGREGKWDSGTFLECGHFCGHLDKVEMAEGGLPNAAGAVGAAVVKEGKLFKRGKNGQWPYAVFEIHLDTCPSPPCCLCLSVGLFISVFLTLSIIRWTHKELEGEVLHTQRRWTGDPASCKSQIIAISWFLQFIGFKNKPSQQEQLADPLNNFTVKGLSVHIFTPAPK